jgi:hypothetical protein
MHIDEACMAAKNNDMQGVLMHLNLALNALGGNMTTTAGGGNVTTTGGTTTGGGPSGNSTSGGGPLEALKNLLTGKK